jgi:hypothetical protein
MWSPRSYSASSQSVGNGNVFFIPDLFNLTTNLGYSGLYSRLLRKSGFALRPIRIRSEPLKIWF